MRNKQPIKYTHEMTLSLTPEVSQAMGMVCEVVGMRPGQYARQALVEKLIRDQAIENPILKYRDAAAAAAKATAHAG